VGKNFLTLGDMVGTTKQSVNLLEGDLLGLGNEEEDKDCQQEVDTRKEVEGEEAIVVKEDGEELLEDGVGDILGLRSHTNGLGANVHRENFGRPNPHRGTPRWFV
jgi:hypothetical protein